MNGSRILVVEDEALIADDIQRTLIRLGYDVPLSAATGREAIAAAADLRPDLALMDIKLQGPMDGIEAAIVIRRELGIPVIYLTSHSDEATLARAMETSPSGYLLKPFSDRELRTAIEVALNKHRLEAHLAERERWFSTTLQSIGDAVIATDKSETITFMNAVAETLTGWKMADGVGRQLSEVFRLVGPTGAALESPVRLVSRKSFAVALPLESALLLRGDGQLAVEDSAASIVDASGVVLGAVVVFRDITERKKLEQRLAQSERLAALGTLAAGMGHEINNPLMAVLGNLTFVTEAVQAWRNQLQTTSGGGELWAADAIARLDELESSLVDASRAGGRVRQIVVDLKKFIGNEQSARTTLEISEVLDSAANLTRSTAREHPKLIKEYGITPYVDANEGQLAQVFTNLLVNAAQATAGMADAQIKLVTCTDMAGRAVAEVSDNGPGMAAEVLARIFDPFFTTKAMSEGMGLGLAISHNIITGLGGEIVAESKPSGGATFRVVLPAARAQHVSVLAAATEAPPSERRGKLLVVDDEVPLARVLERVLRAEHDITVVTTGKDALAKIATGQFYDVVFCDLMMPGVSGMDVYESVATVSPEQARRFVFMTGGACTARMQAFLESTANVVLTKPFDPAAAREIVRDCLGGRPREAGSGAPVTR